jgi:excisionase family DNA binding protein
MLAIPRMKGHSVQHSLDLSNATAPPRPRLPAPQKLLTVKDVVQLTRLSRVTIYRLVRAGRFPAPLAVAGRSIRWPEGDIANWQIELLHKQYVS